MVFKSSNDYSLCVNASLKIYDGIKKIEEENKENKAFEKLKNKNRNFYKYLYFFLIFFSYYYEIT